MPRRISVEAVASQPRTPDGTGIIVAAASARARPDPGPSWSSRADAPRQAAQSPVPCPRARRAMSDPRQSRERHRQEAPIRLAAQLAPPHLPPPRPEQCPVDVMLPRNPRHAAARRITFRNQPEFLLHAPPPTPLHTRDDFHPIFRS
ncbi:MAG: hypothetical protein ABF983_02215 [Acetobacter indonesiensis]